MTSRSGKKKKRSLVKMRKKRTSSKTPFRLIGILLALTFILGVFYLVKSERYKVFFKEKIPPSEKIIFEEPLPLLPEKIKKRIKSVPIGNRPQVAIVIDDLGYNLDMDKAFIKLKAPFSFSFLPFGPHTRKMATLAHNQGKDVLLHLPMEPASYPEIKLGPGALFLASDDQAVARQVCTDIEAVPYIKGVNNHMGSKFTADTHKMELVLRELQKRDLFYLDSRTTPLTRGLSVAQSIGIKSAERDVFLDNIQEAQAIRTQLNHLVTIAYTHGSAIGIGHPHSVTYQVLEEELPRLRQQVEIVPVSELVR